MSSKPRLWDELPVRGRVSAKHFVDDCRHTRGAFPSWTTNKMYEQIDEFK